MIETNRRKEILRSGESAEQLIPGLTPKEILCGIEYSHLMLKPEAMEAIEGDRELEQNFTLMLLSAFSALGLDVVYDIEGCLPAEVVGEIYQKEIVMGNIPDWELERFSSSRTRHFVLKGVKAIEKTHLIKGRFSCNPGACHFGPKVDRTPLLNVSHIDGCNDGVGGWGHGCGVRGYLARENFVKPDPGETEYTVYNWVHTPDPGQTYAVQAIIDSINNQTIN